MLFIIGAISGILPGIINPNLSLGKTIMFGAIIYSLSVIAVLTV